jgi:hypothetical protein
MTDASAWTAAPPGAHIFSPEEVMGLLVHQANYMDATNTRLDAMQADIVMICNFILGGQRAYQPATTRPVLPASTQPTLPALSMGFSKAATINAEQIHHGGGEMQHIEQPVDATTEMAAKMRTLPRSAIVRLQAAVRGLLARRHLQEVRQQLRGQEAVVAAG